LKVRQPPPQQSVPVVQLLPGEMHPAPPAPFVPAVPFPPSVAEPPPLPIPLPPAPGEASPLPPPLPPDAVVPPAPPLAFVPLAPPFDFVPPVPPLDAALNELPQPLGIRSTKDAATKTLAKRIVALA
jgi:hypothetical protein